MSTALLAESRRHGPGLASPPTFRRQLRDHGCEGVPPAPRGLEHCRRRRTDPAQPLPHQEGRPGNRRQRPTATVEQVFALAGLVPGRYRALVLLAAFTSLRYGELAALRRRNLDLMCRPSRSPLAWSNDPGQLVFGPPKSAAGRRTVTIPAAIRSEVRTHLDTYTAETDDALIFTGSGAPLRRSNFHRSSNWAAVTIEVGSPLPFPRPAAHRQRPGGGSGASLADLMAHMGHGSTRAAMIYQHATRQADQAIASALDQQIRKGQDRARNGHAGAREVPMTKARVRNVL